MATYSVLMKTLFATAAFATQAFACGSVDWTYTGPAPKLPPPTWDLLEVNFPGNPDYQGSKICKTGTHQTPINIKPGVPISPFAPSINYPAGHYHMEHNEKYTVELHAESGTPQVTIGQNVWNLVQFHFHTPSEHRIADHRYPMEIHFVHQHSQFPTRLAVLGLLVEGSTNTPDHPFLKPIIDKLPSVPNACDATTVNLDFTTIRAHFLAPQVFNYSGSLTTPPCSEKIDWYVHRSPLKASKAQTDRMRALLGHNARCTSNEWAPTGWPSNTFPSTC